MRHNKAGVKLNRTGSHRNAMFRNMVTSLFKHDRITTTDAKAKELRRWVDKMITLAKRGDLHARRQAMAVIREKAVVHKLFEQAQSRFGQRQGGYTRIVKMGFRPGDAASMSLIELVDQTGAKPKKDKKKAKAQKPAESAPVETKAEEKAPETATPAAESPAEAAPAADQAEVTETEAAAHETADEDAPVGADEAPKDKKEDA